MEQQDKIKEFIKEREWDQYHKPRDLLLVMIEEISEFVRIFKWEQNEEIVKQKLKERNEEVKDFFGDTLWFLASLANYYNVNLSNALNEVISKNTVRFPIERTKGRNMAETKDSNNL